jgi:hypothetical protein
MPENNYPQTPQATVQFFALPQGLYVIRLSPLQPGQAPNPVNLAQAPDSAESVGFFPSEHVVRQTLALPDDCIIIRIKGNGGKLVATEFHGNNQSGSRLIVNAVDHPERPALAIDIQGTPQTESTAATPTTPRKKQPAKTLPPLPLEEGGISVALLGHVQNVGDVQVKDNWLGDPDSNNRLEGFAIKAKDLPEGTKLVYACTFANNKHQPQMTGDGQFIGTRQKAQPIKSVVFTLDGEQADQYQLSGEVAFTGGNRVPLVSQEQLACPDGNGHLVAIHLKITAKPEEEDGLWTEEDIKELFADFQS